MNRHYTYRPSMYGELVSESGEFHHGVYPERSRRDALGSTDRLTDAGQNIVWAHIPERLVLAFAVVVARNEPIAL